MAGMLQTIAPAISRLWNGNAETKSAQSVNLTEALALMNANGGRSSKSGQNVSVMSALGVTAVLACARVKAEGLAQVPCRLFQKTADGGRREATEHPLHRLLYRRPNSVQTSFEFREQIGFHLALCGNAYVFKVVTPLGRIIELLPFDPGCVTVVRYGDATTSYRINLAGGSVINVAPEQMWHIRAASWNGYAGLEPVFMARDAIGLALAAEEFGSELFANGARPSGILTTDGTLDAKTGAEIKAAWNEAQTGSGNRLKTAILQGGLKWQALSQTADEAQFIEARKYQVVEICRAMRVLPIMAMHQDGTAAYASVEQMFLAHLTHTLGPDFERFEQSAEVNLLTEKEQADGYYVELVEGGLMRGTAKDRADFAAVMMQNRAMTANEARDTVDLPRSTDPEADVLHAAANLYGQPVTAVPPPA